MSKKEAQKRKLSHLISHDIAVDLGTANTLVSLNGYGIVIDEPSVVATNRRTKRVIAIGEKAQAMIGRTPRSILAAQPLVNGVVSDFEVTEHMLRHFINTIHKDHKVLIQRPRMVVGLPHGVTEVEKRAVEEAARAAGARKIWLIEEPVAAAIGSGLDIDNEEGSMIVDIGGGTTEIAIMANNQVVAARSIRVAGDDMTEAIIDFIRDEYNLQIGQRTAEEVKTEIGLVKTRTKSKSMVVRGRNIITGLPQEMELTSQAIKKPLNKVIRPIVDNVKALLEEAPAELVSDIMKKGITLTGGGSRIPGIDSMIKKETKVKVKSPKNSLTAVVEGAAKALKSIDKYRSVLSESA